MTKVLFYASPTRMFETYGHTWSILHDHLLSFCGRALRESGRFEIRAIVDEIAVAQNRENGWAEGLQLVEFPLTVVRNRFPARRALLDFHLAVHKDELSEGEQRIFAEELNERLGGWEPDVILAYPTGFGPLKRMFPKSLCLVMENGIFSRPPLPRTLRFDPIGFANGFLNRFADQIRNFPVPAEERRLVEDFRTRLAAGLSFEFPYEAEMREARQRFSRLVLCPVPASNVNRESEWDDQMMFLLDVLERVPRDVGVVITFHDEVFSQLNLEIVRRLQERYANLLSFGNPADRVPSHGYFKQVDAILNCDTMTGTLGMLACPRIVALDRTYSGWMADGVGLNCLPEVLSRPGMDRTGMIYWYLTHFAVHQRHFADSAWYADYFEGLLARYRREGVTFGLFGQNDAFEDVAGAVLGAVDEVRHQANVRAEQERARLEREELRRREERRSCLCKIGRRLGKISNWFLEKGAYTG